MKKKLIVPLVILLVLIVTLVSSVAFFSLATEGQTESSIQIGELTFKYTETSGKGQGINLDDAFPLSDTEGKALTEYFDFKVEGNLTRSDLTYTVELDTTLSDLPDSGIKLYLTEIVNGNEVELNSIVNTLSTYQASDNGRIIYSETIPRNTKNYVKNFRLRMWIDESVDWTDDLYMGHSGTFKVNVKANSNTSVAATDVVTDRTTSLERIVANDKYLFTASSDTGVDYEVTVPYTVNNVDIEVYESNTQATSTITPINSLSGVSSKSTTQNIHTGNNYFKVTTTASNGTTTGEHIVKVIKEADTNNDLLNLGVDGYSLTPVFDKDTTSYTLTLEEPSITITGNKESDTASITGLGEKTLTFGENVFNITVRSESGVDKTYTITVTNSRPIAPAITGGTGTTWVSTNQAITLANPNPAFAISGIDHYEVYDTNTSTAPTDSTVATTTTTGSYTVDTDGIHYIYYRTVSNKGFKSVWSSAQVVYRDAAAPTAVTLTASDTKASDSWHTSNFNLTISATKNGASDLTYYYGTTENPSTSGSSITVNTNSTSTSGITYYAKACNEAGVCSTTNGSYVAKLDKETPSTGTLSSSPSTANSITANYGAASAISNIKSTKCYYGTNNNPTTAVNATGNNCVFSGLTAKTIYYFKKCVTSNADVTNCSAVSSKITAGQVYNYTYTGSYQTFTSAYAGTYKMELWGTKGQDLHGTGGNGGYVAGNLKLNKNVSLYVYVGKLTQSFNIGDKYYTYGGAATDIRTTNGAWNNTTSLRSRIMVAGGGGAAGGLNQWNSGTPYGGAGGGLSGYAGTSIDTGSGGGAGAQTTGSGFGVATGENVDGGSGYYNGYRGYSANGVAGAGGGSSFISGYSGCRAINSSGAHVSNANHFSGYVFTDGVMIDGKGCNWSTGSAKNCGANQPQPSGSNTAGHAGDGYARITIVSID